MCTAMGLRMSMLTITAMPIGEMGMSTLPTTPSTPRGNRHEHHQHRHRTAHPRRARPLSTTALPSSMRRCRATAYTPEQWPIVRRMIHANADFDFNGLTDFHPQAVQTGITRHAAWGHPRGGRCGDDLLGPVGATPGALWHASRTSSFRTPDVIAQAQAENTTRAVQAMRKAHRLGLLEGAIVGIGNAPTALIELARLIAEEGVRPALVVGMPVGFVSAAESKDLIASQHTVPWMVIRGRKGGSTLVVAALHALLALAEARQKQTMAQG